MLIGIHDAVAICYTCISGDIVALYCHYYRVYSTQIDHLAMPFLLCVTSVHDTCHHTLVDDLLHTGKQSLRAKNSYSIERRLMDYVPTAFYGAVVVVSPDARAASSSSLS
jgi:hypothetical protein